MTLQPREKKLAVIVGSLCVVVAIWVGLSWYGDAVRSRQALIDNVEKKIYAKQTQQARARVENARLAVLEERSLPRDVGIATSLYRSWLGETADRAELGEKRIEAGRPDRVSYEVNRVGTPYGTKLPFTLRAKGNIAQTAAWLVEFYRADHLHQIADLSLQPTPDGSSLQITARIEALALDDAKHTEALSKAARARVDEARGAELAAAIVKRNLFAAYVPPPPPPPPPQPVVEVVPPPPPPPANDPAKHTVLTGVVSGIDGEPEAWLLVRTTNQTLKLRLGDKVEVGTFSGKLVRLADLEIEIDSDGKRRIVAIRKSLGDAIELPATVP